MYARGIGLRFKCWEIGCCECGAATAQLRHAAAATVARTSESDAVGLCRRGARVWSKVTATPARMSSSRWARADTTLDTTISMRTKHLEAQAEAPSEPHAHAKLLAVGCQRGTLMMANHLWSSGCCCYWGPRS